MMATDTTPFPPGARILVRDAEWMVRSCVPATHDGFKIRATGVSEFVREEDAVFFTKLERPEPVLLRPENTELVPDTTPQFALGRLFIEATLRRTPLPQSERRLTVTDDSFLLDPLVYQQRPAELALSPENLRPRILVADVVGLGKTLEIGLILAELIRRGRGDRILVVTPQQVLEQFQRELWTRFGIPLIRLDSAGIERIQREIPAGRNPFTYYKRIIISVDTLKNKGRYGHHLDAMDWDAVVIDESHNLIGVGNQRNRLAHKLAKHTDALLLASATPHNGNARSFAELINMLDEAAIANRDNYDASDIGHLYIRRTKISPEVTNEIGEKWAPRGPSLPVPCQATSAEEEIFGKLTRTWLAPGSSLGAGRDRRLFPYRLLKAFLSSHEALKATANNRIKNTTDDAERSELTHLVELASALEDKDSAKLTALVTKLQDIGVGPKSPVRAVVFTESIPTLKWLHGTLPARLGMKTEQFDLMHAALSDDKQQNIVERFSLAESPVRVLLSSDVASEGVNLHKQCHHLIHYDLPWSLIRIEQRNGRIDRYGQEQQPEFFALILTSSTPDAKDDTTVAEKLLNREAQVHRTLGTAEGVTRQFIAEKEEDRLIQDLLAGMTVDESIDAAQASGSGTETDFLAALLEGVGDAPSSPEIQKAEVPRLFASTEEYAREALRSAVPDLHVDDDGELLAFTPPDDLLSRLEVLPPGYLKERKVTDRMRVTFSKDLAQRKLAEAEKSKTMLWPEIGYLSDLHPMIEWLTDKVLLRVVRQQAPVLIADVPEPTFLVQGVYSNTLGQPTVVRWMAVTGLPDTPAVAPMTDALTVAGVGPGMVNTGEFGDLAALRSLIPSAVRAAREHLERSRADYDAAVDEPIIRYRDRIQNWKQRSLFDVSETARELDAMTARFHTAGEPLLRILAVLDSAGHDGGESR